MKKENMLRYTVVTIVFGIVVGLVISAGMDWTDQSRAEPVSETGNNSENPPELQNVPGMSSLIELSQAFATVAERVNTSVVTVFTEKVIKKNGSPFDNSPFEEFFGDEFFRRFFQIPDQPEREQRAFGLGSGVIVDADGVILTNNHVIKNADNIKIRLLNGEEYEAEVKGRDSRSDLAVLKIDADNLRALAFGNSDEARVGEWVLAIGSPLSANLAHSVTSGIISAKGRSGLFDPRQDEDFIQTDAAINPGNSGGALVNLEGELIGVNTAIASRTGGFMGIGFAIPSNLASKVMTDILEKGRVVRGWLGVYIQDVNQELADALELESPSGVLISSVQEDSPAEDADLKSEDVVVSFNGQKIKNTAELKTRVASAGPDAKVLLGIIRDGKEREVEVTLGELPEEETEEAVSNETVENLGIEVANITSEMVRKYNLKVRENGVVITRVQQGSIAARSGLRPGDAILKVNKKTVNNVSDYNDLMKDVDPGDSVLLYVQRGEAKIFIAFTLPEN